MRQATTEIVKSYPTIKELLSSFRHLTATEVQKKLGLSRFQFDHRIELGILPQPTYISQSGRRYFDENWVRVARTILENAVHGDREA